MSIRTSTAFECPSNLLGRVPRKNRLINPPGLVKLVNGAFQH